MKHRRLLAGVTGAAALLLFDPGCGSDAPPPPPTNLAESLSILRTQHDFSAAQVECVVTEVEAALTDDELRDFAESLDDLEESGSTASMNAAGLAAFTDAVAACAVPAG